MKNIKLKRIFAILIGLIMTITIFGNMLKSNADTTDEKDTLYVGLSRVIPNTNFGYAINDPTVVTTNAGKTIWSIVSYTDNTFGVINDFSKTNLYCLKAGAGFYNDAGSSDNSAKKTYKRLCSINDKDQLLASTHTYVKEIANSSNYNSIRWILDNMYVKGESTEQDKISLFKRVGIMQLPQNGVYYYVSNTTTNPNIEFDYYEKGDVSIGTMANGGYGGLLRDDDIVAVQQAALWYFTNGQNENAYDQYNANPWEYITEDSTVSSQGKYQAMTGEREEQSRLLYKYMIDAAKKHGSEYENNSANSQLSITINKDNAKISKNNDKYIVGPINITNNDISYNLNIKVSNESDTEITDYKFVNEQGTELSNQDIKTIEGNFYISVPTNKANKVKVSIDGSYEKRDAYIYVEEGDLNCQPLVVPKTEKNPINVELELTPEREGEYDLILVKEDKEGEQLSSKAIFEVNGVEKEVVGRLEIAKDVQITKDNVSNADIYTIKETKAPDEYCEFDGIITVTVTKKEENGIFKVDKVEYKVTDKDGNDITEKTGKDVNVYLNEDGNIYVEVINYEEEPNSEFDLKLLKRITKVNDVEQEERLLKEDTSKLNTKDEDGNLITTAEYKMTKDPVLVKSGDIVTYTFRVYNEGDIDGYASEITEDIPEGLEFIYSDKIGDDLKNDTSLTDAEKKAIEFNQNMLWKYTDTGLKTISTTFLSKDTSEDNLIKAFDKENQKIDYKEVSVMLKVTAKNSFNGILRNEAEISEDTDKDGNPIDDRDSDTEKWGKENSDKYYDDNKKWPVYKEDDEDYDNIKLQYFDLALRKFITAVQEESVTTRIPVVTYKDGKIVYTHPKDALTVHVGDVVTYTIRVYNEGKLDGYAEEITDDIPDYLEYLPNNAINKEYRWVMNDKSGNKVTEATKADKVITDYLSSKQQQETKRDNLLKAFDSSSDISEKNPDYRDLKIAFKVKDPNSNKYIITNHAQISEDSDDDIDSTPGKWNEGEDDQDIENIKVEYFDLALRKYVTQAIVIENGKQTVTNTGHKAEDDPESIVKVELHRKKLSSVVVKFRYKIKITNEGDIAGYAKEITDYIPQGLKFVAKDNPNWKDEGNNVISTKQLENTLLQPGESTEIEVLLTWINGANNTGLKVNTAEISEDWNEYGVPDRDSTPDNKKEGEDDIDDAPVMLSIATGQARIYFVLGTTVLSILSGGIFLIKKYVM